MGDETANVLMGYKGKDTLTGGAGQDIFVFDTKLSKTNKLNKKQNLDKITDFVVVDDTIHLKKGVLKKGEFHIGAKAHDGNDHVIYNKKTGALFYDPDGTGAALDARRASVALRSRKTAPSALSGLAAGAGAGAL